MFDLRRHRRVILIMLLAPVVACGSNSRPGLRGSGGGPGASGGAGAGLDAGSTADAGGDAGGPTGGTGGPSLGSGGSPSGSGGAAGGGAAGGTSGSGGAGGSVVLNCVAGSPPKVPVTPFRRLSRLEYNNTVHDIFGDSSRPADTLPIDDTWGDWSGTFGGTSSLLAEGYWRLAREQAIRVTADAAAVRQLAGCDYVTVGETACQQTFIGNFLPTVFRRPLAADERADFMAVFAQGRELTGAFTGGVRAVIEVALQSPEFLYRVEFAEPADKTAPAGVSRLTPFELATRLSYLLWASTPDAPLRDAAARGELQTKEQIAAQARRLLADPHAHEVVRDFYRRLFNLRSETLAGLVSASGPFTAELPALLLKETEAFIDEVTWKGAGDLRTLLTAPYTFANARLGQYYGISEATGDALQKVTLPLKQRAGVLTQGSLLASTSRAAGTNPVMRGISVFQRVMCGTVQPPPGSVGVPVPVVVPPNSTTREQYMPNVTNPQCLGCHRDFDPIGFAFEHYDQFGIWRDTENGKPIDATGQIFKTDVQGTFDGALELIARLAASQDVQNCYASNWMTFAFARQLAPEDGCSLQALQSAFARAKGNIPELLVALTQTDAFLYKATP